MLTAFQPFISINPQAAVLRRYAEATASAPEWIVSRDFQPSGTNSETQHKDAAQLMGPLCPKFTRPATCPNGQPRVDWKVGSIAYCKTCRPFLKTGPHGAFASELVPCFQDNLGWHFSCLSGRNVQATADISGRFIGDNELPHGQASPALKEKADLGAPEFRP